MGELLLEEQALWDGQLPDAFSTHTELDERDQRTLYIGTLIAVNLGKLYLAFSVAYEPDYDHSDPYIQAAKTEVMPDCAIQRSRLINLFPEIAALNEKLGESDTFPVGVADLDETEEEVRIFSSDCALTMQGALNNLADASASIGEYAIDCTNNNSSERYWLVRHAANSLNLTAEMLAQHFDVDLADAHRLRIEQLLSEVPSKPLVEGVSAASS